MELSWSMKFRIAAACAVGVVLMGFLLWPLASPGDPLSGLSLTVNSISLFDTLIFLTVAFVTGFLAYFVSWPFGRQIGILAVPAGLSAWIFRSGDMTSLILANSTMAQRQSLFSVLKWESFFWLIIVLVGFLGVFSADILIHRSALSKSKIKSIVKFISEKYLNIAIALVASVLIAQFCLTILAKDVNIVHTQPSSVIAQPTKGQIIFAILVSFGVAAFVVKKFFNMGFLLPVISSAMVTGFAISFYMKASIIQYMTQSWPVSFFCNPTTSILPIQMVVFGTFGSIIGYWLAVQYNYWRHRESE